MHPASDVGRLLCDGWRRTNGLIAPPAPHVRSQPQKSYFFTAAAPSGDAPGSSVWLCPVALITSPCSICRQTGILAIQGSSSIFSIVARFLGSISSIALMTLRLSRGRSRSSRQGPLMDSDDCAARASLPVSVLISDRAPSAAADFVLSCVCVCRLECADLASSLASPTLRRDA